MGVASPNNMLLFLQCRDAEMRMQPILSHHFECFFKMPTKKSSTINEWNVFYRKVLELDSNRLIIDKNEDNKLLLGQ